MQIQFLTMRRGRRVNSFCWLPCLLTSWPPVLLLFWASQIPPTLPAITYIYTQIYMHTKERRHILKIEQWNLNGTPSHLATFFGRAQTTFVTKISFWKGHVVKWKPCSTEFLYSMVTLRTCPSTPGNTSLNLPSLIVLGCKGLFFH